MTKFNIMKTFCNFVFFNFQSIRYHLMTMSSYAPSRDSSSSFGRAMGRLAISPGASPMVEGEGRERADAREASGRSRSEGGVRSNYDEC